MLAVLPFLCLRAQIRVTNYESSWAGGAWHHLGAALAYWPPVFLMWVARLFFSKFFADWIVDHGRLVWFGKWRELYDFNDQSFLGFAWICLAMTVAIWFAMPNRRALLLWLLLMVIGMLAALSGVSAAFIPAAGAEHMVDPAVLDGRYYIPLLETSQRYVFPILMMWYAALGYVGFTERNERWNRS